MEDPVDPNGPSLSEAQLEIMNLVWDREEITVGELWHELSSRRRVARNTVQTLVTRLEEKGWLAHRTDGHVFQYRALHPRTTTLKQMVRRLVHSAFGGSAEGLVMTLLEDEALSGPELDQLVADLRGCDMPYTCPHGRPTLIEMNFRELEKKFGRSQ